VADAIEDKIEHNESKMTYENYLIWLRSYELKSGGGSHEPSWLYRLKRAMVSKISTILARALSQPEKTLMPRHWPSQSSGLRSAWRAVGRTVPYPDLNKACAAA
jgi:hypothetical protein